MIGLRTARVLIVDDNPAEALPIIHALGKLGIGSIYVAGDRLEDLPDALGGLRVIFLDMKLAVDGDEKTVIASNIAVMKRLIGKDPGPTVIVIWTKNPQLVDGFKTALKTELPNLKPGIVAQLDKPVELETASLTLGKADLGMTDAAVGKLLEANAPLDVMWHWEQVVHFAASATTAALLELVSESAGRIVAKDEQDATQNWLRQLAQVLKWLVDAAEGSPGADSGAYQALKTALGAILHDRVEHSRELATPVGIKKVAEVAKSYAPEREAAALNTRILTASVEASDISVRPGNLYATPKMKGLDSVKLAKDILRPTKDKTYVKLSEQLTKAKAKGDAANVKKLEQELEDWWPATVAKCTPVVMEVTPACDYAQGNNHVSKFIAGLLIPSELSKLIIEKKESSKILPAIVSPDGKTIVRCVLSSRFTYGVGGAEKTIKYAPLLRFRTPVVVDVQAWSSSQAARPGLLSVSEDS